MKVEELLFPESALIHLKSKPHSGARLIYQNQKQDSCVCFSVLFVQTRNMIPNQVNSWCPLHVSE